jgi:hypothetical protein
MKHGTMLYSCCTPSGCCTDEAPVVRRFQTKEEQLDELKSYKDELEKELAGVMERIKAIS